MGTTLMRPADRFRRAVVRGLAAFVFLTAGPAAATEVVERPDLAAVFATENTEGTFALLDVASDRLVVVNRARAETRIPPASTFKIVNTLIALDTGAVKGDAEVFPWRGEKRAFPAWERDLTLREAIRLSAVPVFQEIARRIGPERMRDYVGRLDYGNRNIGTVIDRFWLDGPLAISAVDQVRFLARLAQRQLPLSARTMELTRDLLKQEEGNGQTLFAKTGTYVGAAPAVGWWVGWIEKANGGLHAFAINHDLASPSDTDRRKTMARELLARLGTL